MIEFADPIFDMIHRVIHFDKEGSASPESRGLGSQTIPVINLLAQINVRYKNKLFSYMYLVLPKVL